ncbi:MAG: hypothetical protein HQL66_04935 [Magnetococcales bacterium]|nr:hypothetical protein [Magnetococcales bacterium]
MRDIESSEALHASSLLGAELRSMLRWVNRPEDGGDSWARWRALEGVVGPLTECGNLEAALMPPDCCCQQDASLPVVVIPGRQHAGDEGLLRT